MNYASIDIGTNAILLMIAEITNTVKEIHDTAVITRLGEGLKQTGALSFEAMERTINALRGFKTVIDKTRVTDISCVGTAALREARNSAIFIDLVKEQLAFEIRVISEREEAFYTYLSVRQNFLDSKEDIVIIDIGGGSTEIIYGNRENFIDHVSFPVGSVKLTEMFIKHDPPSGDEIRLLIDFIRSTLNFPRKNHVRSVIGTAGTITNLGSISKGLKEWDKKQIHGLILSSKRIDEMAHHLITKTISERSRMAGMEKGREDIILQGVLLLKEIMSYFDAEELIIDTNGVRHGILCERFASLNVQSETVE